MASIADIRAKFPQYSDLSDQQLADALYKKSYSDMPRADFDAKIGLAASPTATMPHRPEGTPEQIATAQKAIDAIPGAPDGHDLGSQVLAGVTSGFDAVPIAGPTIMGALRGAKAAVYGTSPDKLAAQEKAAQDANPVASMAGTVAGNVLPFTLVAPASLAGQALGMSGKLIPRVVAGALSGGGIEAADTAIRGGSAEDVRNAAGIGGAIAGGIPILGSVAKGVFRGIRAPAMTAPVASVLKADAGVGYDAARATGTEFKPTVFSPLHTDLKAIAENEGAILPDGKLASGFPKLKAALKATEQFGAGEGPVTIKQQAILRKIVANAAASSDKTESRIGSQMVDRFDNYFEQLPDSAFVGDSAAGSAAMSSIAKARQAYAKAMRVQTFEDAVTRAKRAGGTDTAYRTEFKSFLNSARKTRGFPPEQLAAIDAFVQGGKIGNLVKALTPPAVALAVPGVRAAAGRVAAGQTEALRGMVAGAEPPSMMDLWLRRLTGVNDDPANMGAVPQSLAALANPRP